MKKKTQEVLLQKILNDIIILTRIETFFYQQVVRDCSSKRNSYPKIFWKKGAFLDKFSFDAMSMDILLSIVI